jgi:hypothetical protein
VRLVTLASVSFALGLLLMVFGQDPSDVRSPGSDTFSYSALGHRGWAETLRNLGWTVVVSRRHWDEPLGAGALLVLAEPVVDDAAAERRLERLVESASRVLIVLPKWRGVEHPDDSRWVRYVEPVPEEDVERVGEEVERLGIEERATGWSTTQMGSVSPTLRAAQLLDGDYGERFAWCSSGALFARRTARYEYILSDPDIVANHGLAAGDNAILAVAAVEIAAGEADVIVFDETLHGHAIERDLWRELLTFPVALASLHVLAAVLVLVAAGMARFGSPEPVAPPLEAGRHTLVENTAELLEFGGHAGHTLARYFERAVRDVVALHRGELEEAGVPVLAAQRIARRRGVDLDLSKLADEVRDAAIWRPSGARGSARRTLRVARRIHAWREEVFDGTRRDR